MNRALILAASTAVLRHLIENDLAGRAVTSYLGGDLLVSALPPDRIPTGAEERAQLNLFLYQVVPNTALGSRLRNEPSAEGVPPLSLDLHYLVTAYGARDFHTEILLGHAVQLLHETPVVTREVIGTALAALGSRSDGGAPALSGLDPQEAAVGIGELRITPHFGGVEEMGKLWSSLQARYRPSVTYRVMLAPSRRES
jgi:hypothetical protein